LKPSLTNAPFNTPYGAFLGPVKEAYLTQARFSISGAMNGGTVTALALAALKHGIYQNILTSDFLISQNYPAGPKEIQMTAKVWNTPDEILAGAGSRYFFNPLLQGLRLTRHFNPNSTLLIGLPCQISGLEKLRRNRQFHDYFAPIGATISLFCGWNGPLDLETYNKLLSLKASQKHLDLVNLHDVSVQQASLLNGSRIYHHTFASSGEQKADESIDFNIPELWTILERSLPFCSTACADFSGEWADLAVGGAVPLLNHNLTLIRTENGKSLMQKATEYIDMKPIPSIVWKLLAHSKPFQIKAQRHPARSIYE